MANESNLPPQRTAEGETVTLPVYQEQLHVDTRLADTGRGVRVHKQVRSHPRQLDQTLWRDELDVRHVPVDRVVSAPPAARYEGDTFIVPVLEEVLVVEKRYRIKEELHITRLRHASRHRQTVPLRAEHVTIERFDDGDGGQPNLTKEATMDHTLAAVFEHRGDADRARTELLNAGFGSDAVRGHTVLTVNASSDDEIERAADIIEGFGPLDIDEQQGLTAPQAYQGARQGGQAAAAGSMQDAQTATGTMQSGTQAATAGAMQGTQSARAGSMLRTTTEEQAIPVIQEELKVGKRTVQRGGVRVYQRVIETPVQEDITLREEHVTIERHPVDQAIAPDQVPAFQEKSFELRESAEEAVVQKTARVVEEVVVGKDVSQRQEQISDTVRSTNVEVEQIAPDIDTHFRKH